MTRVASLEETGCDQIRVTHSLSTEIRHARPECTREVMDGGIAVTYSKNIEFLEPSIPRFQALGSSPGAKRQGFFLCFQRHAVLFHRNGDHIAGNHRIVRDVIVITEDKLQRVLARRQHQCRLGLTIAKMAMLIVGRQRAFVISQFLVDQNVVVPGILFFDARWRDAHPGQSHLHDDRAADLGTIFGLEKINLGTCRRRLPEVLGGGDGCNGSHEQPRGGKSFQHHAIPFWMTV